jgi:DoxX-like protein
VKLVLPVEAMQQGPMALPGPFLRFIGVAEVCGAVGLILPWALRIQPRLTPPAASGLIVIMTGATAITALGGQPAGALFPFAIGC